MVVITWQEYPMPSNRILFSSRFRNLRNRTKNNGSCTKTSKTMKLFNHKGCSSIRKSSFCLIWNWRRLLANDGTYLSGTIACESIKIVAGTCVAKYAMKMRLIKSFILFRVVVVFVRFCQRLARSLFCVRTDKRNLVYYYVYTRTRRVCMCAQKSSFCRHNRYELFRPFDSKP